MRLSILFGQRKEHYEGEYAPEALLVWDEYARDENPEDFDEALEKAKAEQGDGMQAFKVIDIEVDQDKIRKLLVGAPVLQGTIKETP